jgi:two-component system, cell cycle response regulator DivK
MRHPFESRLTRGPAPLTTIVVAGDPDEDGRLTLASGLTHAGYRLRLTATGDELLREARADDVGLVIAEVGLPCADGPCAIEVLKRTPELRHVPVLAYSAPARVVSEVRALSSGADRFLGDPAQLGGVFDVVASMLQPAGDVAETADPVMISVDPAAAEARWADDGGRPPSVLPEPPSGSSDYPGPLERLYARHALISTGRRDGDSRLVHDAIIERLAANGRIAEDEGWTCLALERVAGMGQLRLCGVPSGAERRELVPDWAPR